MLPSKIKLHNFCAVADSEIDLTGISLACIVGRNGSSKSTIFTLAPMFALFGKPRPGTSIDDMVRTGTQDMLVQYEFEHQGSIYQITRTRSLKGKGKSTAELLRKTPTGWESLTGTTIRDTDAKIEALLNLDVQSFLASSLVLQGDVNRFAQALPSERKNILAQVLGLDIYSTLQERAKKRQRALELKLEGNKQELERLARSIEALPDAEAALEQAKKGATLTAVDIRTKENELATIQAKIKDVEAKQQQAQQIKDQIKTLTDDISNKKTDIAILNARIDRGMEALRSEPELLQKVQQLGEIRQQIPALEAKAEQLAGHLTGIEDLEAEKKKLFKEQAEILGKLQALEKELAAKDELGHASERYLQLSAELRELDEKGFRHQHFTARLQIAESDLLKQSTHIDTLLTQCAQTEKKVSILTDSGCIDSQNAKCKFLADAQEAKAQMPILQTNIEQAKEALVPLYDNKQDILGELEVIAYDSGCHADLKRRVEYLRKSAEKFTALAAKEELLENLKEQQQRNADNIEATAKRKELLREQTELVKRETGDLPSLKVRIAELEPFEKQLAELPKTKAAIDSAKENVEKLNGEIILKGNRMADLEGACDDLVIPEEGFATAIRTTKEAEQGVQANLKELQSSLNLLFARQGSLQNQVDQLVSDKQKHATLSQELAPMAKELVRWETLARAFSKNGIPVLILENILPELERIANDILGQMSNGAHTLQFITQRDAKSKDSMIETLDIMVTDWAGTRPFESFSGGEQTRISLAIRFALSELLASRAGSKIEFVVLDEVLSDQSPEFRELAIEGIKALAGRFKKILLISHIPEVQEAFDQRIILSEGDKVEVFYN